MVSRLFPSTMTSIDVLIEQATKEELKNEDIGLNLDICDAIRSKEASVKDAIKLIKKRLNSKNVNTQLLTLQLLEMCMKNCGYHFHKEVLGKEFLDYLVAILKQQSGMVSDVKNKILELIQQWTLLFKNRPDFAYIQDIYNWLKVQEGYSFPPVKNLDPSIVQVQIAPDWTDSDACMRCRSKFTTFNRKHHCRACGQTFCHDCSSKNMALPQFGISKEVRVCENCASKVPSNRQSTMGGIVGTIEESQNEMEPDLKKAIELSLNEARQKSQSIPKKATPLPKTSIKNDDTDLELAAAIEASLKEIKPPISKPFTSESNRPEVQQMNFPKAMTIEKPTDELKPISKKKLDTFDLLDVEKQNIFMFYDLLRNIEKSGTSLHAHPEMNSLYERMCTLQPKILRSLEETSKRYNECVDLHHKLNNSVILYDKILERRLSVIYGQEASTRSEMQELHHRSNIESPYHKVPTEYPFTNPQYPGSSHSSSSTPIPLAPPISYALPSPSTSTGQSTMYEMSNMNDTNAYQYTDESAQAYNYNYGYSDYAQPHYEQGQGYPSNAVYDDGANATFAQSTDRSIPAYARPEPQSHYQNVSLSAELLYSAPSVPLTTPSTSRRQKKPEGEPLIEL